MQLILSAHTPLNAIYTNEEGQALYKVETPHGFATRISTISRVVPNDVPLTDNTAMKDRYEHVAEVVHNSVASSVLRFGGVEYETKDYFRKEGWGAHGRNRVFTGPDGREYQWALQSITSKLYTNDHAKTPVADFHQKRYGIFGKGSPATLEIFPAGEHMVEQILITFIYIEKIRKDKEQGARFH